MDKPVDGQSEDKETIRQRLVAIENLVRNQGVRARVDDFTDQRFRLLGLAVNTAMIKILGVSHCQDVDMTHNDVVVAGITAMVYHDRYAAGDEKGERMAPEAVHWVVEAAMRVRLDESVKRQPLDPESPAGINFDGQSDDKETMRQRLAAIEDSVRNRGARARVDSCTDEKFVVLSYDVRTALEKLFGPYFIQKVDLGHNDVVMAAITAVVYHESYDSERLGAGFEPEAVHWVVKAAIRVALDELGMRHPLDSDSPAGTNTHPNEKKELTPEEARSLALALESFFARSYAGARAFSAKNQPDEAQNAVSRSSETNSGDEGGCFYGYLFYVAISAVSILIPVIIKSCYESRNK